MKKKKSKILIVALLTIFFIGAFHIEAKAEPIQVPKVNISVDGTENPKDYVSNIKLLLVLTVLSMLPAFVIMMTSFTRIIVVFSFLKSSMGAQQAIPNQILVGLALFLTIFIMSPVYTDINNNAFKPYMEGTISQEEAMTKGSKPLREFMLKQTRQKDLQLFVEASGMKEDVDKDTIPLKVVVPAFAISELKTAFQIGFLLYIPFMIIDLVVASVLMSMGMFMLPPVMISLPFKLLLFVMVDGWYLLVKSMIMSFA